MLKRDILNNGGRGQYICYSKLTIWLRGFKMLWKYAELNAEHFDVSHCHMYLSEYVINAIGIEYLAEKESI